MHHRSGWIAGAGAVVLVLLGAQAAHAEGEGDIRITKTVVDRGTNVIVGVSKTITFPVAMTIKDDSGVKGVTRLSTFSLNNGSGPAEWTGTRCVQSTATTSVCTATVSINPYWFRDNGGNDVAGWQQTNATVKANDGDYWIHDDIKRYKLKRASKLTTNAGPEPVAKGGKLTVTGKLVRANWEDLKYHGYTRQQVRLQFKKAGSSSYSTVKTVTTSSTGGLSTTVTASSAGTWRWFFPGTTTTPQVISTGDSVALR